jgi:hypothetical protein
VLDLLKKFFAVVVLVVVAYAGFRWGRFVFPPVERVLGMHRDTVTAPPRPPEAPGPSAELADATLGRFERFRRGEGEDRLALSGTELSSVVRYSLPGIIPPGMSDPTIVLENGRVRVSARVALGAFPRLPHLDQLAGVMPDTVLLELEGSLVRHDQETLALFVDRVQASHVPLPRRMVGDILNGLGRPAPPTLPADAIPVPIPDGVQAVYVQMDSLVLVAKR